MPPSATPLAGRPRLCFMSYRQIRLLAMPIVAEYGGRAEIEVIDGSFEAALDLARKRLDGRDVDDRTAARRLHSRDREACGVPCSF